MAKTRHQADRQADGVHPLRLRPDPRLPGPGAGPAAGLPAEQERPRQDRRPLLRRPARRGRRVPVRRHPQPVPRLRRARAAPGHPGRVGDARPGVGRVARPEHHRAPCRGRWSPGSTPITAGKTAGLDWFRPAIRPGFSDSFGVYNSRWQDYMTWNVQDWSSFSERHAPRRLPAVGRDADAPAGLPGQHADPRQPVQLRHAVGGGAGGQPALPGRPGRRAPGRASSGCRPGPTRSGASCPTPSPRTTSSRSR